MDSNNSKVDETVRDSKLRTICQEKWQTHEYKALIQDLVKCNETVKKIESVTKVMNESRHGPEGTPRTGVERDKIETMEWDALYEVASRIMEEYTEKVDEITLQLNNLNRRTFLWQEAGFMMDSHRGVTKINASEEWITLKETYLQYKSQVLTESIEEIQQTVARLPQ